MTALQAGVVAAVVLGRLVVPLAVPRRPVPGLLGCLLLDAVDQSLFALVGAEFPDYQSYDKALDVYYLAVAYASTLRNWAPGTAFVVARALWYYRLVGVAAFELTGQRWLLLVFPNTFEYFFLAYELVRLRWDPRRLSRRRVLLLVAVLWVGVKLPQEWWLHVAMLDATDVAADHPRAAAALAAGVLAVLVAVALVVRRHGPSPDRRATTAVDRHLPRVGAAGTPPPLALHGASLLLRSGEKALLVALTVVVFAQVVPDVRASVLQIVVTTTLLVLVNAAVSQAFARGGLRYVTAVAQFGAMAAVNAALVGAFVVVRGAEGATFDPQAALFFGLLLTLLVTLVDRYRAVRRGRWGGSSP